MSLPPGSSQRILPLQSASQFNHNQARRLMVSQQRKKSNRSVSGFRTRLLRRKNRHPKLKSSGTQHRRSKTNGTQSRASQPLNRNSLQLAWPLKKPNRRQSPLRPLNKRRASLLIRRPRCLRGAALIRLLSAREVLQRSLSLLRLRKLRNNSQRQRSLSQLSTSTKWSRMHS